MKEQGHLYPEPSQLPGATVPPNVGGQPGMGYIHQQPQHQQQPQQVYVVQGSQAMAFGPNPSMITCPSCHESQMTRINYESSTKTHLFATILCLTTCCCCIPYCIDSCKNANHHCGHCGAYLGTYNN